MNARQEHPSSYPTLTTPKTDVTNWVLASLFVALIAIVFLIICPDCWHWFVLPVCISGVLIGKHAFDWVTRKGDILSPVGIIGIFGFHFFFLAPLLHVYWGYYFDFRGVPSDWRPWLGCMALLNVAGLIVYLVVHHLALRHYEAKSSISVWTLRESRIWPTLAIAMIVSGALQVYVYAKFGGVLGYIYAYEEGIGAPWDNPLIGMGWLLTLAESFPAVAALAYVFAARSRPMLRRPLVAASAFVLQFGLLLVFGGLRGSRLNVLFGLFWFVGLIHIYVRPLKRSHIALAVVALLAYMNLYFFFKTGGVEGFLSVADQSSRARLVELTGVGEERKFIVLHDFGRSDIQALALYLMVSDSQYNYALGRTYWGGIASVVPRVLWPNRPETVVRERTELIYGSRSPYGDIRRVVPYIFGLAGEAMLNFGPYAGPFTFVVLALLVAWVGSVCHRWQNDDSRRCLIPLLVGMCVIVMIGDSHVVFIVLMQKGLVPFTVLAISSQRRTVHLPAHGRLSSRV